MIQGYRGLEFRDTQGDDSCRNNWIRGICQYGIMPANGMVYLPPHNCSCYPEAKLFGLWTLKASESTLDLDRLACSTTLVQGPAYGEVGSRNAEVGNEDTGVAPQSLPPSAIGIPNSNDWPMHRRDARRSGVMPAAISAEGVVWKAEVAGRLSAPVVANDTKENKRRNRRVEILIRNDG